MKQSRDIRGKCSSAFALVHTTPLLLGAKVNECRSRQQVREGAVLVGGSFADLDGTEGPKREQPFTVVGFHVEGGVNSPAPTLLAEAAAAQDEGASSPTPVIIPPSFQVSPCEHSLL